ncbi:unnamed protein product, partial [Vitis vinifera]|uniref:Uncharacterized protein n=1 Tax=Vitis vinifera TaxID=29760 RepID=D7SGW6_VITVI
MRIYQLGYTLSYENISIRFSCSLIISSIVCLASWILTCVSSNLHFSLSFSKSCYKASTVSPSILFNLHKQKMKEKEIKDNDLLEQSTVSGFLFNPPLPCL